MHVMLCLSLFSAQLKLMFTLHFTCHNRSVCHGYLALKELGRNMTEENTKMYDGSWTEWSQEEDLPKILPDQIRIV